jgi:hypothetical protein
MKGRLVSSYGTSGSPILQTAIITEDEHNETEAGQTLTRCIYNYFH